MRGQKALAQLGTPGRIGRRPKSLAQLQIELTIDVLVAPISHGRASNLSLSLVVARWSRLDPAVTERPVAAAISGLARPAAYLRRTTSRCGPGSSTTRLRSRAESSRSMATSSGPGPVQMGPESTTNPTVTLPRAARVSTQRLEAIRNSHAANPPLPATQSDLVAAEPERTSLR